MAGLRRFDIRQAGRGLLIFFGVLAAANIGFFLVFVQPEQRAYREITGDDTPKYAVLSERKEEVEKREEFLRAVRQAENDLSGLRDDVLVTRDERLVDVQHEVAKLCEQFGIEYGSVNYSNTVLADVGLDRLGLNVPLEGNYGNLRRFLEAVEKSSRFLLVEKVALSEAKDGGKLLSLNINMATYFDLDDEVMMRAAAARRRG